MKNGARHIDLLDYLRGVAILAVLVFHTLGMAFGHDALPWRGWFRDFSGGGSFLWFLPIGMIGQGGVAVFFVVSGFCIHFSFETQGGHWGGFYVRRFFRIYPPYLLALLLSVVILAINPGLDFFSVDFWRQLLSHVFLVHNFDSATIYGFNAALWSLAVEAQLYLLYPILSWLAGRIGWGRALAILAAGEVLIRGCNGAVQAMGGGDSAGGSVAAWLGGSAPGYWFSWALGAHLARAWLKGEPLPFARVSPWPWLGLALGCHFVRPLESFQFLLFAVTTAITLARGLSAPGPELRGVSLPARGLRWIGLWSYSLYLLHQPLLHVYSHLIVWAVPAEQRPAPVAFLLLAATWLAIIPLSALWYELIEVPGISLGRRMLENWGKHLTLQPAVRQGPKDGGTTTSPRPSRWSDEHLTPGPPMNPKMVERSPSPKSSPPGEDFHTRRVWSMARSRRFKGPMREWFGGFSPHYWATRGLLIAALAVGLAGTLWVSYEFSMRAAVKRCREAWVLATSPDAAHRNASRAVKLAEDACLQTQYRQSALIATLSATYAEAGRFDEAIGAAQSAGRMAAQAGDESLRRQCEAMLAVFVRHKPFRDPTGNGAP